MTEGRFEHLFNYVGDSKLVSRFVNRCVNLRRESCAALCRAVQCLCGSQPARHGHGHGHGAGWLPREKNRE